MGRCVSKSATNFKCWHFQFECKSHGLKSSDNPYTQCLHTIGNDPTTSQSVRLQLRLLLINTIFFVIFVCKCCLTALYEFVCSIRKCIRIRIHIRIVSRIYCAVDWICKCIFTRSSHQRAPNSQQTKVNKQIWQHNTRQHNTITTTLRDIFLFWSEKICT